MNATLSYGMRGLSTVGLLKNRQTEGAATDACPISPYKATGTDAFGRSGVGALIPCSRINFCKFRQLPPFGPMPSAIFHITVNDLYCVLQKGDPWRRLLLIQHNGCEMQSSVPPGIVINQRFRLHANGVGLLFVRQLS